jgi:hypothetical protein
MAMVFLEKRDVGRLDTCSATPSASDAAIFIGKEKLTLVITKPLALNNPPLKKRHSVLSAAFLKTKFRQWIEKYSDRGYLPNMLFSGRIN